MNILKKKKCRCTLSVTLFVMLFLGSALKSQGQVLQVVNNANDQLQVLRSFGNPMFGKYYINDQGLVIEAINPLNETGIEFHTNGVEHMRIRDVDGNVGIGTQMPESRLHVNGKLTLSGVTTTGSSILHLGIERAWDIRQNGTGIAACLAFKDLTGGKSFQIMNYNNQVKFQVFSDGGHVFIGDLDPYSDWRSGYRLFVDEGILTERVKVGIKSTSNWSDFVFDEDYELASLSEVEAFIEENHHLPDVPSAKEMVLKGLDVAKSDALLLQKIEELTLYVIQQQKEIEDLKSKVQ